MKKFFTLTKVLLKSGFGNGMYNEDTKKGRAKKTAMYVFLAICLIPFIGMMGYMGYAGYNMFDGFNTGIILGIICYMGVFMAFFTGMTMCVGIFFNSSDTEFLLPMPLKAEQIVGAKFITMYVYTLATDLMFVLPAFIGYGIAGRLGVTYWIMTCLVSLVLPITPLVYGGIFSMLLVRVFKKARNKDFLTVISSIIAIIAVLGINAFTSSMETMSDNEIASLIYEKGSSIMEVMNNIFPNTVLAEKAVSNESPVMIILFMLSAAEFAAVFILVAKFVYIKTVVEMSSSTSKGKAINAVEMKKAVKRNSQIKSYVIKELKLVFRTPIYFMNCAMLSMIWPIILLIPILAQMFGGTADDSSSGFIDMNMLTMSDEVVGGICILAVFGITIFAISFSMMNSTCISREGKNVIFMKYIPMSFEKQLIAKVLPGIILTLITGTGYSIIGIFVVIVIFESLCIPFPAFVLSIVISVLSCVVFNLVEIISDIIKPKLEWQTEQAAVKQNMVAIIPMFLIIFIGIALALGAVWLKIKVGMSVYAISGLAIIMLLVLAAAFYKIDIVLAKKYFAKY